MAVSVEVVSPVSSVTESTGNSTVVDVVRTPNSPINTDATRAVVDVVGSLLIAGFPISPDEPTDPYENQIWLQVLL